MAKILIVTPIYKEKEYCLKQFMKNLYSLNLPDWEHVLIDNSKTDSWIKKIEERYSKKFKNTKFLHVRRGKTSREALTRAQALGRKIFLDGDYTHFLSLESDIFPPKNGIKRLLVELEPVVTGFYYIGHDNIKVPCITIPKRQEDTNVIGTRLVGVKDHPEFPGKKYIDQEEIDEYKSFRKVGVIAGGMGCCLIQRHVLEEIQFQYEIGLDGHSDVWFFNACYRKGIPVFVIPEVECDHQNSDWRKVVDR